VKEDDADRKKRRASTEKQKSVKDAVKKKEKKKNLERQALEERRAKSRRGGSLSRTPLTRMMRTMMMTAMIPRGWQLASTGSYKIYHKPMSSRRMRVLPRGHKANHTTGAKRRRHPAAPVPTRPLLLPRVVPFLLRNSLQCLARDIGSKPW
jgi:hypothetical protein